MANGTKKVISAGIGYIIGGLLIKGISFITTPIFTRLVSVEEFGMINKYISIEAFFIMFIGFQIYVSYKSANLQYKDELNGLDSYHCVATRICFVHSLIILLLLNLFPSFFIKLTGLNSRLLLNLLVLNSFGAVMINMYNAYVALSYSYKKYLVLALLNAIVNVALSIVLILTFCSSDRALGRIFGYALPYICIGCYIFINASNNSGTSKNIFSKIRFAYFYSIPLFLSGFVETVLGQFGKLSVDKFIGIKEMGVYSLSYNIYSIIGVISLALDYVIGPFFFQKRKENNIVEINEITNSYFTLLTYISIFIMLLSPEITWILGGGQYKEAVYPSLPLVASSYIVFICYTINQEILYTKKTYLLTISSVLVMGFNVFLNFFLIQRYGIMGAAYATLLSYFLQFIFYYIIIKYILKSNVFNWKIIFLNILIVVLIPFMVTIIIKIPLIRFIILLIYSIFLVHVMLRFIQKYTGKNIYSIFKNKFSQIISKK